MTIQDLMENEAFAVVNAGEETDRAVESVYCCDLLSVAMGHAPAGCAWVTVMGNINTLVVLAGGAALDEAALQKARQQGITVLSSQAPIFETALSIHEKIHG